MHLRIFGVVLLLVACSPTFNWRDIRMEATGLKAVLPCKPDKATRDAVMGDRPVKLQALGCEAGGATFAVMHADVGDAARAGLVLAQWQQAALAGMAGASAQQRPFVPPGALALAQSVIVTAAGRRPDGSKVESRAAYFARGSQVFQAVIYADQLKAEMAESFFAGLAFE